MKLIPLLFILIGFPCFAQSQTSGLDNNKVAQAERAYLVKSLSKIADPVLVALSKNELRKTMPVECVEGALEGRKQVTYLEAFGRLLSGMAPWLELGADDTAEGKMNFHWDYYNSFVIQPMLIEILKTTGNEKALYAEVLKRAKRYAAVQERFISPEGTYPPIGRSLAYRFGAFQYLAQMALLQTLPEGLKPQQVRAALYTVIKKQLEAPGTFDEKGWLQIGFYGHQPNIEESYISTGSLYLCAQGFLILGLKPTDEFWTGPDEDWTQRKIWNGRAIPIDHSIEN